MCKQTASVPCWGSTNNNDLSQVEKMRLLIPEELDQLCLSVSPQDSDSDHELERWPTPTEGMEELKALGRISGPMVFTGLLYYSRAMISMMFLGYLGGTELAGGALSIGFANITGYSVISGLAMGMEPICGQAYGAKRWSLMYLTLQRTILVLLCVTVPIAFMWMNMERILIWCGQDEAVAKMAGIYILFSLPDLLAQAFLHPFRIFLRTQNITFPLTWAAAIALTLHVPINFLLVVYFKMGIAGVAAAAAWTNLNMLLLLLCYLWLSGVHKKSWEGFSRDCFKGWSSLLRLAIPSCVSVCLEWWWYEFMIILCGLLMNPKSTVASMGILIQTTSLIYIFPSSLSMGVSTRVGNELGANRPAKARRAMIVALASSLVLGFVAMSFAFSVRYRWAKLFTQDPEILMLTSAALPILGLCELGNCPQTTGCGVLRGSARPTLGANINLGSFYFIGMPVALVTGFVLHLGFVGLWLGLLAAQASCLVFMLYHLVRTDWNLQAERAIHLTGTNPIADQSITLVSIGSSSDSLMIKALWDIENQANMHKSNKETGPLVSECVIN